MKKVLIIFGGLVACVVGLSFAVFFYQVLHYLFTGEFEGFGALVVFKGAIAWVAFCAVVGMLVALVEIGKE